jgi:ankyrin repeat protein
MLAAVRGYADIVKILLNLSRVDIESRYEYSEFYSNLSTALHLACQEGHSEIVRLLCDKSANLNAQDRDGRTPLHIATRHKRLSCIEILLNRGCDISIVDREGRTAVNYLDNLSQTELTSEVRRVQRLFRALKRSQPTSVVSESSSSRRRRL